MGRDTHLEIGTTHTRIVLCTFVILENRALKLEEQAAESPRNFIVKLSWQCRPKRRRQRYPSRNLHAEDSPDCVALRGIGSRINSDVSLNRLCRNKRTGSPTRQLDVRSYFILPFGELRFFHTGNRSLHGYCLRQTRRWTELRMRAGSEVSAPADQHCAPVAARQPYAPCRGQAERRFFPMPRRRRQKMS